MRSCRRDGPDILRSKGILAFQDEPKRYVFQGVHMILDGELQRDWKPDEKRIQPHRVHRPPSEGGAVARGVPRLLGGCESRMNILASILRWGALLGGIGFLIGFVGPVIFFPEANQGPLLGIFITGPGGFVLGLLA